MYKNLNLLALLATLVVFRGTFVKGDPGISIMIPGVLVLLICVFLIPRTKGKGLFCIGAGMVVLSLFAYAAAAPYWLFGMAIGFNVFTIGFIKWLP